MSASIAARVRLAPLMHHALFAHHLRTTALSWAKGRMNERIKCYMCALLAPPMHHALFAHHLRTAALSWAKGRMNDRINGCTCALLAPFMHHARFVPPLLLRL